MDSLISEIKLAAKSFPIGGSFTVGNPSSEQCHSRFVTGNPGSVSFMELVLGVEQFKSGYGSTDTNRVLCEEDKIPKVLFKYYLKLLEESKGGVRLANSCSTISQELIRHPIKTHVKRRGTLFDKNEFCEVAVVRFQNPTLINLESPNSLKRKASRVDNLSEFPPSFELERNIKRTMQSSDVKLKIHENPQEDVTFPKDYTFNMKMLHYSFQHMGNRPIMPSDWKLDFNHLVHDHMSIQYCRLFSKPKIPFIYDLNLESNADERSTGFEESMILNDERSRDLDISTRQSLMESLRSLLELEISAKEIIKTYSCENYDLAHKIIMSGQSPQIFRRNIDRLIEQKSKTTITNYMNSLAKAYDVGVARLESIYHLVDGNADYDNNQDNSEKPYEIITKKIEHAVNPNDTQGNPQFSLGLFGPLIIGLFTNGSKSDSVTRTVFVSNLISRERCKEEVTLSRPGLSLALFGAAVVREAARCQQSTINSQQ